MIHDQFVVEKKLHDNIVCPKCKGRDLFAYEHVEGANIYTANSEGEIISISTMPSHTISCGKITFECHPCKHRFRKNGFDTWSRVFVDVS